MNNIKIKSTTIELFEKHGLKNNSTIFVGLRDPGEANALLPVITKLIENSANILVLADGDGQKILQSSDLGFSKVKLNTPISEIIKKVDVVLTGISEFASNEPVITLLAH